MSLWLPCENGPRKGLGEFWETVTTSLGNRTGCIERGVVSSVGMAGKLGEGLHVGIWG